MSHHIPFDIQSQIMKRLPVKSLLQFRAVSKRWKSSIDSPKFIKNYHINHSNPQHQLLVQYVLDDYQTYTSIVDNNTFPQQKFPITAPESLHLFTNVWLLNSVDGLVCFCDLSGLNTDMVVIWNPTVRKSVGIRIPIPKVLYNVVGFGVCPYTRDPKLVNINVEKRFGMWEVEIFTLSTRVWKTVYMGVPFKSCTLSRHHVFVDGVIYFRADDVSLDDGVRSNIVISFEFKSEKFGEVCLPEILVHTPDLYVTKVNGSLGLLEYYDEGGMKVCGVWSRKDGAHNPFTKIYIINVEGKRLYNSVLGFRNNGEVVMEVHDADNYEESRIEVHEPLSGHINNVGIYGKEGTLYVSSYMETLLLLDEDESDSIIPVKRLMARSQD